MDRDVRAVLTGGAYGLVGGTALGLASLPFSGKPRNIFLGTSIGLYLGLVAGFYHVWHRDDPENPFRAEAAPRMDRPELTRRLELLPPAELEARVELARF